MSIKNRLNNLNNLNKNRLNNYNLKKNSIFGLERIISVCIKRKIVFYYQKNLYYENKIIQCSK